ncbi:MAG: DNA repair protein RecO [Cytophagales bacterium]|nr:DNA repair protein RecO [Bernardetiaceae bacterium]MDW8203394.1 DNA repair protein RecO [Cytophagales bacterium]
MLVKTKGIVIRFLRYRETSLIVRIYTEALGLRSYIVNGVRSTKSGSSIALYQPLALLELTVYEKPGANLQRISDARLAYAYRHLPFSIVKTTIALFLAEILHKTLKEEKEDAALFTFLFDSLKTLDRIDTGEDLFHLVFMVRLAALLGFGADSAEAFAEQLQAVRFPFQLQEHLTAYKRLLQLPYGASDELVTAHRSLLIDALTTFFALHAENFGTVNALEVLRNL